MNIKKKLIGAAVTMVSALGFVSCGSSANVAKYEVVNEDGTVVSVTKEEYDKIMRKREAEEQFRRAKERRERYEQWKKEHGDQPPPLVYGPPPTF